MRCGPHWTWEQRHLSRVEARMEQEGHAGDAAKPFWLVLVTIPWLIMGLAVISFLNSSCDTRKPSLPAWTL